MGAVAEPPDSEAQLVQQILTRIGSRPDCRIWRSQPLAARTKTGRVIRALPKGHPDIAGVLLGGRAIFIECKAKTKLSSEQDAWRRMLQRMGALWVEAHSVEDVEVALVRHDAKTSPF